MESVHLGGELDCVQLDLVDVDDGVRDLDYGSGCLDRGFSFSLAVGSDRFLTPSRASKRCTFSASRLVFFIFVAVYIIDSAFDRSFEPDDLPKIFRISCRH